MDDYLSKPVELAGVSEQLRSWLGATGGADDAAFAAALLLFEQQTGPALDALEQALRAGEIERARSIAHRIRGGAGMLGALRLAERCGEIGRTPAAETILLADLLSLARQDYAVFLDDPALRRHRASGSGGVEGS